MSNLNYMKKYYIIIILISAISISGCSSKKEDLSDTENQDHSQVQGDRAFQNRFAMFDNMPEAQISDVIIGAKIMVMGTQNSDGSISADRILIGNDESSFENIGLLGRQPDMENQQQVDQNSDSDSSQIFERPNFDPSQFQNMSDEERSQMREQMAGQRGNFSGTGPTARTGTGQQMVRIVGEVIKIDETNIVLKVEGGSKLIFFSGDTSVNLIK